MKKAEFEALARDNGLLIIELIALVIIKSAVRWNDKYNASCMASGTLQLKHWRECPSLFTAVQNLARKGFVRYEGYYSYRVMRKGWQSIPFDLGVHTYFQSFNQQNVIFKTISYKDQSVDIKEFEKFSEKS